MKLLLFVLFALMASLASSEDCTTEDGVKCNLNHPFNVYFNANPCFEHGVSTVCFFDETNYVKSCDCTVAACKCGSSSEDSSTDDSSSEDNNTEDSSSDDSTSDSSSDSSCSSDQTTYCALGKDNTMCEYCGVDSTNCGSEVISREITEDEEKTAIVDKHNELRRKVAKGEETLGSTGSQPSASNMNALVWDDEVAKMAQTWADQCASNPHDTNRKMVDGSSSGLYCGQNVYESWSSAGPSSTKGLAKAVQAWYDEVKDFDKSAVKSFFSSGGGHTDTVGHYTQVVWGDVSTIGCGYVYRIDSDLNNYYKETVVCNYCKGGNMLESAMYTAGDPASACSQDHPNVDDGLCTV